MIPPHLSSAIKEYNHVLEGWCSDEKASVLCELILKHKPTLCVESGVFGGRSIIAMGFGIRENNRGMVIGVDPWSLEAALEGEVGKGNEDWWKHNVHIEKIYVGFVTAILQHNLTNQVRWIRAKSVDAAKMIADGSVNLFHQDSNHSEKVSCLEVETWLPKMAPNSIYIIDDSDWPTQAKAIRAIAEGGFHLVRDCGTFTIFSNAKPA